jgi:hypothetical protein
VGLRWPTDELIARWARQEVEDLMLQLDLL